MEPNAEEREDDGLENRKAKMQAYYKSGARISRGEYMRNRSLQNAGTAEEGRSGRKKQYEFSRTDFIFVLCIAGFYDLLSFVFNLLPIVGGFISSVFIMPAATLNLFIMYRNRGISFKTPKSILKFGGTSLIELIPVINALPAFMLNVFLNYTPPEIKGAVSKVTGPVNAALGNSKK